MPTSPETTSGPDQCDEPDLRGEAWFRFFAESLADLVWSARPDGSTDYYNRRFLAPEVLVDDDRWEIIRRRQTLEDVLALEI